VCLSGFETKIGKHGSKRQIVDFKRIAKVHFCIGYSKTFNMLKHNMPQCILYGITYTKTYSFLSKNLVQSK